MTIQATLNNDTPVLSGVVMFATLCAIIGNSMVDIIHALIDPRGQVHLMAGASANIPPSLELLQPAAGPIRRALRSFNRWPIMQVAMITLLVICALFADIIAPYDPIDANPQGQAGASDLVRRRKRQVHTGRRPPGKGPSQPDHSRHEGFTQHSGHLDWPGNAGRYGVRADKRLCWRLDRRGADARRGCVPGVPVDNGGALSTGTVRVRLRNGHRRAGAVQLGGIRPPRCAPRLSR